MMRSPAIRTLVCGVILFGFAATGAAQVLSPVPAFTGTGVARIERPPKLLRVVIPVAENAEDVSDALKALTEAAATARKDLIRLGAAAGHITITEPDLKVGSGTGANMFDMMAEMGLGGGVAPEDDGLVTVQLVVTADFRLPEGDWTEILDHVWSIQREIRDAAYDFGADDGGANLQQAILQQAMNGEGGQNPNETGFLFLASVTKEERAALLREAFENARADAAELAQAAGTKLGVLRVVSRDGHGTAYTEFAETMMASSVDDKSRFLSEDEIGLMAVGSSPGTVELKVTITAGFDPVP